jgi:hypothetical protein
LEILKGRVHLTDLGIDRRIILKMDLREVGCGSVDWIHLAQDTDWWLAPVNMVINICVLDREFLD